MLYTLLLDAYNEFSYGSVYGKVILWYDKFYVSPKKLFQYPILCKDVDR